MHIGIPGKLRMRASKEKECLKRRFGVGRYNCIALMASLTRARKREQSMRGTALQGRCSQGTGKGGLVAAAWRGNPALRRAAGQANIQNDAGRWLLTERRAARSLKHRSCVIARARVPRKGMHAV